MGNIRRRARMTLVNRRQGNMPKVNSKILRQKISESGMLANLVPIAEVRGGGLGKIWSDSICMPRIDP